jgi:cytochrome bd ubiquinol oxidase subunit II
MLETIWFLLWGLLWAIYFMLDGYDLGLGTAMPFVARSDKEIRTVYNAMGPFWDGNEVWLITAGGVTFAAFPTTYAVMFSTLYSPLLLLLFGLIIRAVSFEFRGKIDSPGWRKLWDTCLFLGSFVPALLLGVAFANIFQGIPFDDKGVFHGTLFTLLNPYGILGGVLFVVMFVTHGLLWLALKTEGPLHDRAGATASNMWVVLLVVTVAFLVYTWSATHLYDNYLANPLLLLMLLAAVVGLVLARVFMAQQQWWKAWFSSCFFIVTATLFLVIGLFPNLYPSSLDPVYSLTIYNSASSPMTLKIMLVVALIFVPIVIAYQGWTYYLFKHKITDEDLHSEEAY